MISKEEAEELAEREGHVFFMTDAGLDHKLYVYVRPHWEEADYPDYFFEIGEIIFEWYDKKETKQRMLKITENNFDFEDAPEQVQDAYRKRFFDTFKD
ncbi:hypothetical protein DRO24_02905 [Candidatus Bathyarchaeota archaeon]|nr:MAG: hypothetical protein DRO24_02905 [Candidatus Bathyarchaeota archaeon]